MGSTSISWENADLLTYALDSLTPSRRVELSLRRIISKRPRGSNLDQKRPGITTNNQRWMYQLQDPLQ